MKHFTLLLFSTLLIGAAHGQLLNSNFSSWTDGSPDGWLGSKSSIDAENVLQADNDGGQGDFAAELVNAESSHKRFTTQQLTVEAGVNYEINFWARGTGDVRTGLFDDRVDGFGYVYNGYITINSADWAEYTQSIIAEEDTDIAEFILSVRNSAGDLNIQIDRVEINSAEISTVSVFDIQNTADPEGASPLVDQSVTTGGVVSAMGAGGFFIQNGSGPSSGIFVFSQQETTMGDSVIFSATVVEYFNMTQLSGVTAFTTINNDNAINITDASTAQVNEEAYEGVVVKVSDATCTDGNSGFGQFIVNDGSGPCLINPTIFEYNGTFNETYNITGPVFYNFEEFKIMPRFAADVEIASGVSEITDADEIGIFPNPVREVLNVQWTDNSAGTTESQLFDVTGKMVRSGVLQQPMGTVEVHGLTPGWYTLNLRDGAKIKHTRIIVER